MGKKKNKNQSVEKDGKSEKACPLHGSWLGVWNQVKMRKGRPMWIKLKLTPDLFAYAGTCAAGIVRAMERGYLEIKASLLFDNYVHLSVLIDENLGDEDGFGVEPDEYLEGVVAPDGTFIEPLHIV